MRNRCNFIIYNNLHRNDILSNLVWVRRVRLWVHPETTRFIGQFHRKRSPRPSQRNSVQHGCVDPLSRYNAAAMLSQRKPVRRQNAPNDVLIGASIVTVICVLQVVEASQGTVSRESTTPIGGQVVLYDPTRDRSCPDRPTLFDGPCDTCPCSEQAATPNAASATTNRCTLPDGDDEDDTAPRQVPRDVWCGPHDELPRRVAANPASGSLRESQCTPRPFHGTWASQTFRSTVVSAAAILDPNHRCHAPPHVS